MKTLTKRILGWALPLLAALPMMTACFDDSELWESIKDLQEEVDELKESLNNQIDAFNDFMKGANIKTCEKNSDGSYKITLTTGVSFVVYPDSMNCSSFISYKEIDGVKYWALYDADGNLNVLTDSDGEMIPIDSAVVPTVKEVDGVYYLVVDGVEYVTGYEIDDSLFIFSDYKLNTDEAGNVYSVTFTFGDDMTFTVSVADYSGLLFISSNPNFSAAKVLTEYYVANGLTESIYVTKDGVVDYVAVAPSGWRVKEIENVDGTFTFDVTAPAAGLVEAGSAEAEGYIKVVSVLENGKSTVSKLYVTTEPFKAFKISTSSAVVTLYPGIQKFAYGVCLSADYDAAGIMELAESMLTMTSYPTGSAISMESINMPVSEIYGSELSEEDRYVFWAIPAQYDIDNDENPYYFLPETLQEYVFGSSSIVMSTPETTITDAVGTIKLNGVSEYYGGTVAKTSDVFDVILYNVNNGIIDSYTSPLLYEGSLFSFPTAAANEGVEVVSGATYITWVLPVLENVTEYTAEDIIYKEFTINSLAEGGSITPVIGEGTVDYTSINASLTAEGAAQIRYCFYKTTSASRWDDARRLTEILNSGVVAAGSEVTASVSNLRPEDKMSLMAIAVDEKGNYGGVAYEEYVTPELPYNSLTVTVDYTNVAADNATLQVTVSGGEAVDYVYWVGKSLDPFWTSNNYLGKSKTGAAEFMALYPDNSTLRSFMANNPISEDGVIEVTGLAVESEYVAVVIAKDESGNYSKAGYKLFSTLAMDLGTLVTSSDQKWTDAIAATKVEFIEEAFHPASGMMSASYAINFSCPTDLTALVLCGTTGYVDMTLPAEKQIIELIPYIDKKWDLSYTPRVDAEGNIQDPDDVSYDFADDPYTGHMLNLYMYHTHGVPSFGYVTYFSPSDHDASCEMCQEAQAKIDAKLTKEYYVNKYGEEEGQKAYDAYMNDPTYYNFYKNSKPYYYVNDGGSLIISAPNAVGDTTVDKVFVILRELDTDGTYNYYEPYVVDLPEGCFVEAETE